MASKKRKYTFYDLFKLQFEQSRSPVMLILRNFWNILIFLYKGLLRFGELYPNTSQSLQLISIYICAVIDLSYNILNNIFALGYVPELFVPFYPLIEAILTSPILRAWTSPEKVFFLSFLVIELMIVRRSLKFSKLVKYNVLLVFALLMVQGLVISYWDLLFHRQITTEVTQWIFGAGMMIYTDRDLAVFFFLLTFLTFFALYVYLVIKCIHGNFATIPRLEWLTDSVAFWLRIKTPTMRFGKRRGTEK